ncbi:hypothetical protein [Eubacterium sp. AB3007]|uniref:hypothetical protein n=1 Tax=Eubacterium sp. AB3007 TaxID=1392487 RepID=UPI000A56E670|nr:hypothetical protein [Eubacterium sp. AB3007]
MRAGEAADKMKSREKYFFYNRGTFDACVRLGTSVYRYANSIAGHRLSFREVAGYLEKYLDTRKEAALRGEITPRTLARERAQLSKVWMVNLDHYKILPCHAESDKGRGSDRYFNPNNHKEQLDFYRAIGARKAEYRDLSRQEVIAYRDQVYRETGIVLKPDIHGRVSNLQLLEKDNRLFICVAKAKHGKTNVAEILPQNQEMVRKAFETGKFRDYYNPSDHTNVHQCRREYAQAMYQYYARDITTLRTDQLYICRGRYAGRIYDRDAVAHVAECLGHARNDLFDTIHNYLR